MIYSEMVLSGWTVATLCLQLKPASRMSMRYKNKTLRLIQKSYIDNMTISQLKNSVNLPLHLSTN